MLLSIIIATFAVSLISFVGIVFSYRHIKKLLHLLISFAAGALIAVSFFDLLPEALEGFQHAEIGFMYVVAGIVLFFLVERFIHWHHCDKEDCHDRPAGILILTGDFVHNFLDGVLIAGAFMLNTTTGIFTTVSVAIHEIPQEFGDFAVLLHAGFRKRKALLLNFVSALSAVLGGILGFFMFDSLTSLIPYAVLLTAGGFLYIALSDIVPSMHRHEKKPSVLIIESILFIGTILGFFFLLQHLH